VDADGECDGHVSVHVYYHGGYVADHVGAHVHYHVVGYGGHEAQCPGCDLLHPLSCSSP
jgi:hypothetical protein